MKFESNKKKVVPASPFAALATQNMQPGGPGIGVNRAQFVAGTSNKRKTPAAQVFGDTPKRDGPFAQMAEPLATAYPSKARVRARKKPGGPNPFNVSKPG
jgi:hypothetical protein